MVTECQIEHTQGIESMVWKDFKGPGPYPAHYTLPATSLEPFAHLKPSTSNIDTSTVIPLTAVTMMSSHIDLCSI